MDQFNGFLEKILGNFFIHFFQMYLADSTLHFSANSGVAGTVPVE